MFRPTILLLTLLMLGAPLACDDGDDIRANEEIVTGGTVPDDWDGPVTKILEDNIHAIKQNSSLVFNETTYDYSHTYGYTRLFNHLNASGYPHDRITGGTLTPKILGRYDVLFINLVSDTRPEFSEEEIEAILDFVYAGGGLFVVADHTNVYEHAQRVNPILNEVGINVRYECALDTGDHVVEGRAWILMDDIADHPVTADVTEIAFLTGGTMDGPQSMANISAEGWGDHWNPDNEEKPVGKYGNWVYDEDEDMGPLSVSQAVEYGAGRVYVIGDQNTLGNPYLYFMDNSTMAFNAVEWLAHRENDVPRVKDRRPAGFHLRVDTRADRLSMSQTFSADDHFTFFVNLSRYSEVIAHATRWPLRYTPDLFMVVDPVDSVLAPDLAEADRVLTEGGQVMLIVDATKVRLASSDFLSHFVPDPGLETSDGSAIAILGAAEAATLSEVTVTLPHRDRTEIYPTCPALTCPGHALITGTGAGGSCDLVCEYAVGNGRLILAFTGAFFYQPALGGVHTPPAGTAKLYYELQMELLSEAIAW